MRLFLLGAIFGAVLGAAAVLLLRDGGDAAVAGRGDARSGLPATAGGAGGGSAAEESQSATDPLDLRPGEDDPGILARIDVLASKRDSEERARQAAALVEALEGHPAPPVASEVLDELADSILPDVRMLALLLATGAEPPGFDHVASIASRDPEASLRAAGSRCLGRLAQTFPRAVDLLQALSESPDPRARLAAVVASREGGDTIAELSAIITEALDDPDPTVRAAAVASLSGAGREGAAAALALLRSGSYESGEVPLLAKALVSGGRFEEALTVDPRPEIVTAVIRELDSRYDDEEMPDHLRCFAGRFAGFLPLYRPTGFEDGARFFRLAIHAEESEFVLAVALSPEHEDSVRRAALRALLSFEPSRQAGIDAAENMLVDAPAAPVLRVAAIRELVRWRNEPEPCGQRIVALIERVAREDELDWIQETARTYLD
jgi:hypothetical protein